MFPVFTKSLRDKYKEHYEFHKDKLASGQLFFSKNVAKTWVFYVLRQFWVWDYCRKLSVEGRKDDKNGKDDISKNL